VLHVDFQDVNTVVIRGLGFSKLYQHFRERDLPCGLQDSLCTIALQILFAACAAPQQDQHSIRVGGLPYPTGTLTRQETPSFARRDNAYPLLTKPRKDARAEVSEHGHPKKLR